MTTMARKACDAALQQVGIVGTSLHKYIYNDIGSRQRRLKYCFMSATPGQAQHLVKILQPQFPMYDITVANLPKGNGHTNFWGLTITFKRNPDFLESIKWEISEDAGLFGIDSVDDLESWADNVLNIPSGSLKQLLDQIPPEDANIWYLPIDDYVDEVIAKIEEELSENGAVDVNV